ncbi:MAG TPA: type II toxin-antitoxin system RelE/ParE family toxin [Longimicrobium sp.]|nr:type II toxin-antitoxin system RelE/ParE family toxin [Longimicrobium sp.]
MDDPPPRRPLFWVGASKKDFLRFPEHAVDDFGHRLWLVQSGVSAPGEKALTAGDLQGLGIRELRVDFDRDTYRVVYTVKLATGVYVLHAFKKKSKFGISTPVYELDVVRQRYLRAVRYDAELSSRPVRDKQR